MTPEELTRKLEADKQAFKNWFNNDLPDIVGVEAVNHFTESFQNEGFTDETLVKWQEVKRRSDPKRPDRAAATRKILSGKTGDLGRSIEYKARPGEVVVSSDTMRVGSDKDYASAHNEGTTTAGRGNSTTIPKRQFMGRSKVLEEKIMQISKVKLMYIFK
jgi:phage gpG-like protein